MILHGACTCRRHAPAGGRARAPAEPAESRESYSRRQSKAPYALSLESQLVLYAGAPRPGAHRNGR